MSKILLIALLPVWLFAAFPADYWLQSGSITLARDQFYTVGISKGGERKDIRFRWTLYKNEGLVMHLSYSDHVHQFILYRDYQVDSFKLKLFPKQTPAPEEEPYIRLVFNNYSRKDKIASFDYYVYGGRAEFEVDVE